MRFGELRDRGRSWSGVSDEQRLAERVLDRVRASEPAAEVEVAVSRNRLALTRFANSAIHQNVAEDTLGVHVTVHHEGRTVSGSSTVADESGFHALVERTVAAARLAPLDPGWPGVAPPAERGPVAATGRRHGPGLTDRAGGVGRGLRRSRRWPGDRRLLPDQPLVGGVRQLGRARRRRRRAPTSAWRASPERLAATASPEPRRAGWPTSTVPCSAPAPRPRPTAGVDPVELPPDHYEVVLEPTAVADILEAFTVYGFNAKAVAERRSFVRLGDEQFDPSVHLVDDAPAAGSPTTPRGRPIGDSCSSTAGRPWPSPTTGGRRRRPA